MKNYIVYCYQFYDGHFAYILDYGFSHSKDLDELVKEHGYIVYSSNTYYADVIIKGEKDE